jgi:hypothetical protein
MKKVAVILLCGQKLEELFWKSYLNCKSGYPHDLIFVHRNFMGVPNNIENIDGSLILENKIINGNDVPHLAFGAYRHFFYKYRDDYEYFIFISDDVVLKRDNWLKSIVDVLSVHEKIGFGASQILHGKYGNKKYPHPPHLKAPFWFAKTECLNKIDWQFQNTWDGELSIADQCTAVNYVGVQVGNKINLGYDSCEANMATEISTHVTQILEKTYYPHLWPYGKHDIDNPDLFVDYLYDLESDEVSKQIINVPDPYIGSQNAILDTEPFHGLIYYPSLETAKKHSLVTEFPQNINILSSVLNNG